MSTMPCTTAKTAGFRAVHMRPVRCTWQIYPTQMHFPHTRAFRRWLSDLHIPHTGANDHPAIAALLPVQYSRACACYPARESRWRLKLAGREGVLRLTQA